MPRGGSRTPKKPAAVSGPGKFSKRTDGAQPVRVPRLSDSELQYGDVQKLEQAQQIAPLPEGVSAPRTGAATPRRMTGEARVPGRVPPYLLQGESAFPGEPISTGLPIGAGAGPEVLTASQPGPDIRVVALQRCVDDFGNEEAREMLHRIREGQAATLGTPAQGPRMAGRPQGVSEEAPEAPATPLEPMFAEGEPAPAAAPEPGSEEPVA